MHFKKLIFVSGKGGTGKTTMALRLCNHLKAAGKRTLLVELNSRSSAVSLAGWSHQGRYEPVTTPSGYDHSCLTGRDCLVEYISSYVRTKRLTQQVFETHWVRALVDVAPGLNDLAILGKLTSSMREHGPAFDYDHIVVDSPSTGSFLSLLQAPQRLGASVSRGPLHTQSHSIAQVLKDPQQVQYVFMALLEELPVDELEETLAQFKDHPEEQLLVVLNKYIDLEELQIPDSHWQKHMGEVLQEQTRQRQRVLGWSRATRRMDLVTEDQPLADLSGEFLPCL